MAGELPPGFELDKPESGTKSDLPPGFEIDKPADTKRNPFHIPYVSDIGEGITTAGSGLLTGLTDLARLVPGASSVIPAPDRLRRKALQPSQSWFETGGRIAGEVAPFAAAPALKLASSLPTVAKFAARMAEGTGWGAAGGAVAPTEHGEAGEIGRNIKTGAAVGAGLGTVLGPLGIRSETQAAKRSTATAAAQRAEQTQADLEAARRAARTEPAAMKERVSSAERAWEEAARASEAGQPSLGQQFATSEYSYIMQPIGGTIRSEGPQALGDMYGQITDRLNEANSQLRLPYAIVQELPNWLTGLSQGIDTPAARETFGNAFNRLITQKFYDQRNLTGRRLAETITSLNKEAERQASSARLAADAPQRYQIADMLHAAADRLMEAAEGPQAAKDLRERARTAYGRLMEFQRSADVVSGLSRPQSMLRERARRAGSSFFRREGNLQAIARDQYLRQAAGGIERATQAARDVRRGRAEAAAGRIAGATERAKGEATATTDAAKQAAKAAKAEAKEAQGALKPSKASHYGRHTAEFLTAEAISALVGHPFLGTLPLYFLLRASNAFPRLGQLAQQAGAGGRMLPQLGGVGGEEIGRR